MSASLTVLKILLVPRADDFATFILHAQGQLLERESQEDRALATSAFAHLLPPKYFRECVVTAGGSPCATAIIGITCPHAYFFDLSISFFCELYKASRPFGQKFIT